jgi:hypothetical protein
MADSPAARSRATTLPRHATRCAVVVMVRIGRSMLPLMRKRKPVRIAVRHAAIFCCCLEPGRSAIIKHKIRVPLAKAFAVELSICLPHQPSTKLARANSEAGGGAGVL